VLRSYFMKETYPKHIVNAVVIVLITIIIAVTFTINYDSSDKARAHCYKNRLIEYSSDKWKEDLKTKEAIEAKAAPVSWKCLTK
jgi:hypothetical protein